MRRTTRGESFGAQSWGLVGTNNRSRDFGGIAADGLRLTMSMEAMMARAQRGGQSRTSLSGCESERHRAGGFRATSEIGGGDVRTARGGHAFDSSFRTCHSEDARRSSAFGARPIGAIDSPGADRDGAIDPQDMPRRIAAWAARARNGQPVAADIMADREQWNALPHAVQDYAFADIDRHPALVFAGAEVFECGGQSHRVGLFRVPALADAVFVAIPGGRYMFQGSIPDVIPPMLIAQTQTTQRQWRAVPCGVKRTPGFQGDELPMESISWLDIQEWLEAARKKVGLPLDLPHESQWEYACRAGTTTAWCFGDDAAQLDQWAWYSGNSGGRTHPVGQLRPNAFGLYDMHGNVWEWCANEWSRDPVPFVAWEGEQRPDPTGSYGAAEAGSTPPPARARRSAAGSMPGGALATSASASRSRFEGEGRRADRGGSWNSPPTFSRSSIRHWFSRGWRTIFVGLRPAIDMRDLT